MGSTQKLAVSYALLNKAIQHSYFKRLMSFLDIKPGSKCLDIGCGAGNNTAYLADKIGKKGFVTGIDPDEHRINIAKKEYQRENVDYIIGKSTSLPEQSGGYDLVISNCVMHWIEHNEKIQTYERVQKLLKESGVLAICEVASVPQSMGAFFPALSPEQRNAFNGHFLTIDENRAIFNALGFQIVKMEPFEPITKFQSLDDFLSWSTATTNDENVDYHKLYEDNKGIIDIPINCDGTVDVNHNLNYIIANKK